MDSAAGLSDQNTCSFFYSKQTKFNVMIYNLLKFKRSPMLLLLALLNIAPMYGVTSGGFAKISHSENSVVVNTMPELLSYLASDASYTIYVHGSFTLTEKCRIASNKALIGTAVGATISGQGFVLDNVSNVVIEGLNLSGIESDAITIKDGTKHIWVNHCTFSGNDSLCINVCPGADSITISGNRFKSCEQACSIGKGSVPADQDVGLRVTLHDNYFSGTASPCIDVRRSPLCHIYRSQMYSVDVAVASTMGAKVLVEDCDGICDSTAYLTQYGDLEEGHIKITDDLYCDYYKEDATVPSPSYEKEDLVVDYFGIYAYLPEYYSGASSIALGFNTAADYDGVGIYNFDPGYLFVWGAYHSGKSLRISPTPEEGSSYALIQGPDDYVDENYFFDGSGEFVWFRIYTSDYYNDDRLVMGIDENDALRFSSSGSSPFRLQKVKGSIFRIICGVNEKCLEVENASQDSGAVVRLATCKTGKTNQMFYDADNRNTNFSSATGVVEPISETEISIYPNPAQSTLNIAVPGIQSEEAYTLELFNTIGQTVLNRTSLEGELNTIDIGSLPTGVYWVKLVQGKQTFSKKLIKN